LLSKDYEVVKLTDFGLSAISSKNDMTKIRGGTLHYMSPEQFKEEKGSDKSDVYAFGCVLYALSTGHPPWHHLNQFQIAEKYHDNKAPFDDEDMKNNMDVPVIIKEITEKSLKYNLVERTTTEYIYTELREIWKRDRKN